MLEMRGKGRLVRGFPPLPHPSQPAPGPRKGSLKRWDPSFNIMAVMRGCAAPSVADQSLRLGVYVDNGLFVRTI